MKFARLAAAAALALGLAASAAAQTTMRMGIVVPQNSSMGVGLDAFIAEVHKRTSGRYKIMPFYSGALGGDREMLEAMQLGIQELAFISTGAIPNFVPEARILDIPFLFRDGAHARAVLDGPIGQEMLAKFEPKGFKGLAWSDIGFRHLTNNRKPVKSPEDMKGMKLRTMENPVHIAAFRGLGVAPTPIAWPEVFTALQQGTVDGQESPLPIIMSVKFEQVQKYLTLTGHVYGPAIFIMSKAHWDKIAPADQRAFLEAAREGVKVSRARNDEDEKKAVAYLRGKGMVVVEDVDRSKFVEAMAPANAEFERQFGKAAIDRIRNAR